MPVAPAPLMETPAKPLAEIRLLEITLPGALMSVMPSPATLLMALLPELSVPMRLP